MTSKPKASATEELANRYKRLYAGVVYDAMYYDMKYRERFVINREIKMLSGSSPVVGRAFTCWGTRPSAFNESASSTDDLDITRLDIFQAMRPGEVVVMDTDRDGTVAHFGDITAQIMQAANVAGIVIDGYTRDLASIRQMGFPLFARGSQPQDAYGKWGLCKHGIPVQYETTGGNRITINPGDWIFGDADGVLVIPRAMAEEVCAWAEKREAHEKNVRAALHTDNLQDVYKEIGRW